MGAPASVGVDDDLSYSVSTVNVNDGVAEANESVLNVNETVDNVPLTA